MSVELLPGHYPTDPEENTLFEWLESNLRDRENLLNLQHLVAHSNPVLYRIISDAAAELAPGDPKNHATLFGSFLLTLKEMDYLTQTNPLDLAST